MVILYGCVVSYGVIVVCVGLLGCVWLVGCLLGEVLDDVELFWFCVLCVSGYIVMLLGSCGFCE